MFLSSSHPGLRVLLGLHRPLGSLALRLLLSGQWRQHQHLLLWRAGQQVLLHQQGPGGPGGDGGTHLAPGLHAGHADGLSDGHDGRLPDLSLVSGLQEETGYEAEEWVATVNVRLFWQSWTDDLMTRCHLEQIASHREWRQCQVRPTVQPVSALAVPLVHQGDHGPPQSHSPSQPLRPYRWV